MHSKSTFLLARAVAACLGLAMLAVGVAPQTAGAATRRTMSATIIKAAGATTTVVAQPANGGAAQVRWNPMPATTPGWYLQTYDTASGYVGAVWCFACTSLRVPNLTVGHSYAWLVYPMGTTSSPGAGPITGAAVSSNTTTIAADSPPSAVTGLQANAAPADETVSVTWQPSTVGAAADSITLTVLSMPGQLMVAPITVAAFSGQKTFFLVPGQYAVRAEATNSAGKAAAALSNTFTIANTCSGGDVCLHVKTSGTQGAEQLVAQGFLQSVPDSSNASLVPNLHPGQWRLNLASQVAVVAPYNPVQTQVVSDHWFQDTGYNHGGYAVTPWSDWAKFSTYVGNLVKGANAYNVAPTYWDLFNEPDGVGCGAGCKYFSVADQATVTTANLLQTMLVEYQAIKAADPTAKVVGPSLLGYHDVAGENGLPLDMATFVSFAAANGIKLDAISWHENSDFGYRSDWGPSSIPFNIPEHVARARQLLAQNPAVGNPVILINEYGTPQTHTLPAWQLGTFGALERAGVGGASRSCWGDCNQPSLDGLLGWTGKDWSGTLPAYWMAKAYADMASGTKVATDSTASWRLDALSVRQDSSSTVRVLFGQHWSCDKAANGWCQSSAVVPAAATVVTIDWPYATPAATVTVNRIAAGPNPISSPTVVSSSRAVVNQGKLVVSVPAAADGDGYSIVATGSR
jgi:hypothetical protein